MEADVDNTGLKRTASAMLLKLNEINTFGANELQGVKPFVMYWISRVFRERFIPAYSRLTAICLNDLGKDLAHLFRSCPDQTISFSRTVSRASHGNPTVSKAAHKKGTMAEEVFSEFFGTKPLGILESTRQLKPSQN